MPDDTRRLCFVAAALTALLTIFASLYPFDMRALPAPATVERLWGLQASWLDFSSRADVLSNVWLFVPIGFFCAGALAPHSWRTAAFAVLGSFALSVGIEAVQLFSPVRTASLTDIAADTAGGALGLTLWMRYGPFVVQSCYRAWLDREPPRRAFGALLIYAFLIFLGRMLPLDFTIRPAELMQKYREGRIAVVARPALNRHSHPSPVVWRWAMEALVYCPVGALCALGSTGSRSRRHPVIALLIGATAVAAAEVAQIFVYSRSAALSDVGAGWLGIAMGIVGTRSGLRHTAR